MATSTKAFDTENFLSKLQSIAALANRPGTPGEKQAAVEALKRMQATATREAAQLPSYEAKRFLERVQAIIDGKPSGSSYGAGAKSSPYGSYRHSSPPPPPNPPFKTGWAWNYKKNKIGKIVKVWFGGFYGNPAAPTGCWNFTVKTPDGLSEDWQASDCRKATQEEIDSATASKSGYNTADAKKKESAKGKAKAKTSNSSSSSAASNWKIFGFARCQEGTSNKVYGYATDGTTWVTFWGKFVGPYTVKAQSNMREAVATYEKKVKEKYVVSTADSSTQSLLDAALTKSGLHSTV